MDTIHHVPAVVRLGDFPWSMLQERAHIIAITETVEQSIELVTDGIRHGLERGFNLICLIDEKHGRTLRNQLDAQNVAYTMAVADGRLRWVDSTTNAPLRESIRAACSLHPEVGIPLILALPIWSDTQRTPAAMRDTEAALHRLASAGEARIVCCHPISSHRQTVLLSAIDAHPQIWFEGRLTDNPFHVPIPSRKSRRRAAELLRQRFILLRRQSATQEVHGIDRATAHELNNLLAAIIGNTDILQLALPPNTAVFDQLRNIYEAARRAAEICRYLPAVESQPENARHQVAPEHVSPALKPGIPGRLSEAWSGRGKLLLVDDEEAIRVVGKQILERLGFSVVTACDGYEAIDIYKNTAGGFRVVILDLLMPRMTGQEAFQELRQMQDDLPILIASGLGAEEIREKFPHDPFLMTLPKPFGIIELTQALKNLLGEDQPDRAALG